jgi:hypothetical protein
VLLALNSLLLMILASIIANAVVVCDVQCEFVVVKQETSSTFARWNRLDVVVKVDETCERRRNLR